MTAVRPRRRRERARGVKALLPVDLLPRPGIVARQEPTIVEGVEIVSVDDLRWVVGRRLTLMPE